MSYAFSGSWFPRRQFSTCLRGCQGVILERAFWRVCGGRRYAVYRLSAMDGPVRPRPLFLIGPENATCKTGALSLGELLKSRLRWVSSPDGFA
jgi:hypothetical protein